MNKKNITIIILCILILFILIASFKLIIEPSMDKVNVLLDKPYTLRIDDKDIKIVYKDGDEIDTSLTYGNIDSKVVIIKNTYNEDVTCSLKFNDSSVSNESVTYNAYISYNNVDYNLVLNNQKLTVNSSLLHNIVIPKNSSISIKIEFKSNMENVETLIKGRVEVTNNLSNLELYHVTLRNINNAIEDKISDLNGITVKGYYLIDIKDLSFNNDANVSGYVLIDSTDISNIKYIYTVYNNKYLIKNSTLADFNVINVDNEYVNNLNKDVICYQYDTRIKCNNFTSIPKNNVDYKKEFYNNVIDIINEYKDKEVFDESNYIFVIDKNNIEGYILLNKNDMFIYLRNTMFMISGYNYKKLGEFDIKSTAIRTYNESAFALSASDKNKVCVFSGFEECYDENNNRV